MECVNCTACIDECDTIMESVGLPKGLIRYASEDEIVKKEKFQFTTRMKGYTAVLAILIGLLIGMLFLRNDVEATILRLPGQLFEHKGENISNVYTYKIAQKDICGSTSIWSPEVSNILLKSDKDIISKDIIDIVENPNLNYGHNKRVMNDFIDKINYKLRILLKIDSDIITQKKSSLDKRIKEYSINKSFFHIK